MHLGKNFLPTRTFIVTLFYSSSSPSRQKTIGDCVLPKCTNGLVNSADCEHFETKEHGHQRVKDLCHDKPSSCSNMKRSPRVRTVKISRRQIYWALYWTLLSIALRPSRYKKMLNESARASIVGLRPTVSHSMASAGTHHFAALLGPWEMPCLSNTFRISFAHKSVCCDLQSFTGESMASSRRSSSRSNHRKQIE